MNLDIHFIDIYIYIIEHKHENLGCDKLIKLVIKKIKEKENSRP